MPPRGPHVLLSMLTSIACVQCCMDLKNVHSELPNTTFYAWGTSNDTATFPGPTLLAKQNVPVYIKWENYIRDATHMLPLDDSIEWANPTKGGVPVVPHLHGAETESASDGHPDSWFTSFGETGSGFVHQDYTYVNEQPPTALWYHDHTVGITRLNIAAGLSGMYILRSEAEESMLPMGIPLIVQDRQFYANGSIMFPATVAMPDILNHIWCPEYYGDTILVNGKAWPFLKVFRLAYRFRLLNASNARFLILSLSHAHLSFHQIGTDGGFLEEPMDLKSITIAPAERVDFIVDFSSLPAGTDVYLNHTVQPPAPNEDLSTNPPKTKVAMKFAVVDAGGCAEGITDLPIQLSSLVTNEKPLSKDEAVVTRQLTARELDASSSSGQTPLIYILDNKTWTDKTVSEKPMQGTTEIWEIINPKDDAHSIHVHLIQFRVLNQQEIDGAGFLNATCKLNTSYGTDGSCFTTPAREPLSYQRGWKDSVVVWPGNVTRLIMRFTQRDGSSFGFDPTKEPGYIWHCHVAGHEDWSMMRPLKIQPPRNSSSNASPSTLSSPSTFRTSSPLFD